MTAQPKKKNGQQVVFLGLCAVVVLAPLPLGSARPLAWDAIGLAIAILIAVFTFTDDRYSNPLNESLVWPTCLFGAVIVFVAIQTSTWVFTAWWNSLWNLTADTLETPLQGSIAIDRSAALVVMFRFLCYAGTFFLAFAVCQNRDRAGVAMRLVAFSGAAYAIYGLIVYWSGNHRILWYAKWAYPLDLTGTFVNRNSFATYLGLCLIAMLGRFFDSYKDLHLHGDRRARLKTTIEFISGHVELLLSLFSLATALILTHSVAGNLSTVAGIFALVLTMTLAPSLSRYRKLGWIMLPLFMAILAFLISGSATLERLLNIMSDDTGRPDVYRATIQAITDYPVLGTGAGSFVGIFPIYRPESIRTYYYDLAHNDYLQNSLELGIPASICLFAAVCWLIVMCLRGMRIRQRDAIYPCVAVAASVLVGLHATVDFSLQIPAVTVTYMFLLGIGVAQSRSSRVSVVEKPSYVDQRFSGKPDSAPDQLTAQP